VVLLALAYFPVLERLYGRTLGKFVCRVRVVDAAGARPSWGQVAMRTLLRLFEVNPAVFGGVPAGIAVLASKKRQRLGDMAANTFVLREEDYRSLGQLEALTKSDRVLPSVKDGVAPLVMPAPPIPTLPPLPTSADSWLLPINRSGWCVAAGYLGLFAVLALPAPFALVAGVLGLRDIRLHPGLGGRGRALFGIVMGGLFSILLVLVVLISVLGPK
jgi:hypothetical protein